MTARPFRDVPVLDPVELARRTAEAFGRPAPKVKRAPVAALPFDRVCAAATAAARLEAPAGALVLTLPMPPSHQLGRGQSRDPRTVAREKRAYFERLDAMQQLNILPPPPATPIARAVIAFAEIVVGAMHDEDNLAFRVKKWPADWLVTRGYLATDRPAGLTWAPLPAQRVSRSEPARITLIISPRTDP